MFKQLITDVMSEFEKTFSRMENRDSNTREPLGVTIERQGKLKTQEQVGRRRHKKSVSAGHTDTEQDTTSPTSHIDYNREEEDNSTPFTDNMQKNSGLLTESEEKIFSETLSRASFENDPEIPFN